jgi:peptidoglycan/xylan/chitin deacetylase (PgdA/CDA1 family)
LAVRLDDEALCTFTFDDCPRSALVNGGRILEERDLAGTFFVTGKWLDGSTDEYGQMLRSTDLLTLVQRGHELGCHSFSHRSVRSTAAAELNADLDHNREVLLGASAAESLTSFAYPFGESNWTAKAVIARRFAAARGIYPAVNGRVVDLAQLNAVRIYAHDFSAQRIQALIARTVATRGWLIFYTHDVGDSPSNVGCTAKQFAQVVDLVAAAHLEVLPMRSAIGRIMHRAA